jgi:hypothetical protein
MSVMRKAAQAATHVVADMLAAPDTVTTVLRGYIPI